MISYLLLLILFGLIVLLSIGTLILGLVRKRKKVLVTAAILFIIGTVGCVLSTLTYTRKLYDYVRSKEFQADAKKSSKLMGETAGSVSSGISKGLSTTLDDEAVSTLAKKSATIIGKSIKSMASGFDSTIGSKSIFLDQTLSDAGFELGRANEHYNFKTSDLGIFIDYKKDFTGKLRVTNYDHAGKKIDVADKEINAKAGQGKVEVFSFSHSDLGITTYYTMSKVD